jgi:hypothetical protein
VKQEAAAAARVRGAYDGLERVLLRARSRRRAVGSPIEGFALRPAVRARRAAFAAPARRARARCAGDEP